MLAGFRTNSRIPLRTIRNSQASRKAHLPRVPRTEVPTRRSMADDDIGYRYCLRIIVGASLAVNVVKGFGRLRVHHPHVRQWPCDRGRAAVSGLAIWVLRADPCPANESAIDSRPSADRGHGFAIGGPDTSSMPGSRPFEARQSMKSLSSPSYGVPA